MTNVDSNMRTFWQEVKNQMAIHASLDNEEKAIDYVCTHFPQLINQPELGGLYPIHIMISKSNFERTQRLLLAGANLELKVVALKSSDKTSLAIQLAQRFNYLNALEIAAYYKDRAKGSKKKIAENIYNLIASWDEKQKIENSCTIINEKKELNTLKLKI
jgi:hypothetical protein